MGRSFLVLRLADQLDEVPFFGEVGEPVLAVVAGDPVVAGPAQRGLAALEFLRREQRPVALALVQAEGGCLDDVSAHSEGALDDLVAGRRARAFLAGAVRGRLRRPAVGRLAVADPARRPLDVADDQHDRMTRAKLQPALRLGEFDRALLCSGTLVRHMSPGVSLSTVCVFDSIAFRGIPGPPRGALATCGAADP